MREFARLEGVWAATLLYRVESPSQSARELGAGESRRHFRSAFKVRWPVELQLEGAAGARRIQAESLGISLGGTFVVSDEPPPIDTDLRLWLHPPQPHGSPGPRVLRLLARVRWINDARQDTPGGLPRGFGVAFRALTAADEIALHRGFSRSAKVV